MNLIDSLKSKVSSSPAKWHRLRALIAAGESDELRKHARGMGVTDRELKAMRAAVGDFDNLTRDAAQLAECEAEYRTALDAARENYDAVEMAVDPGGVVDMGFRDAIRAARVAFDKLCTARRARQRLGLLRRNYPKLFADVEVQE